MLAGKMLALLLVLFATGALSAPFAERSGSKDAECKKQIRFPYGREYSYNYEGETITSVNGSSNAQSALKIKARCSIRTVGSCQHVLKIDSVELWEAQSKNVPLVYRLSRDTTAFARGLQAHDLYFRSSNGAIIEVSPHQLESSKIFNIKKGILSAFQVQFVKEKETVSESDVAGKCRVNYRVHAKHLNGRPKVITKTRNLKECSERTKTNLGIHFHQYNEKSLSLFQSATNCKYVIHAKKFVDRVVCYEKHLFRPFSSGINAGASSISKQTIRLQKISKVKPNEDKVDGRLAYPLLFQHDNPLPDNRESSRVIEMIETLARQSMEETKPESARLFSKLVFSLRKLGDIAIQKVWDSLFECDECTTEQKLRQTFLLDAIPHCGTSGCAKVINHAIKKELVNGERGNMFLSGLALVNSPSEEMIEHVLDLCQAKPSRTGMLTLGTLIHKYCEDGRCESLDQTSPIARAERYLSEIIGKSCQHDKSEMAEKITMALKAIGNAGRPFDVKFSLLKCAMNDVPKSIAIAALEALRRMPCSDETTNQLLSVYGNSNFDVEIRIASYLALVKCPSVDLFKRISEIQRTEVNKQVGSFVWSHITNAMESTEPVYGIPMAKLIRKALKNKMLREFNLNRLRFSRSVEMSYYNDLLGAGGSVQGHLIYHPNSYFPRSTHFNMTVDILGASINLLEAAARFEGFESLIEQYFGDDGYYPDKRIMEMFNLKPHEEMSSKEQKLDNKVRGRRSIIEDINKVEPQLEKLNRKMDNMKHKPSGAVSVKLFGNEIRVASFDDINWLQNEADNVNMIDLLIKLAKGGKKTYTKSLMFLDVETVIPTILGLPLKLDAKGTSVVTVEMNGKFDIRNMFWGPMAFDVRGNLKPSAVVEVAGRMSIDAIYSEAGVLLNTSMYTSTQIHGNGTYKQGQVLKFEVGAPTKPVQIFNVSSSLLATLNGDEVEIRGTERRFEPSPCLNITRVLGVAVCGRMSLPIAFRDLKAPFFPLSGPASFSLSVLPTDPKLTVYKLVAQRLPTEEESNYDIIAKISTPGATWEREFEANASLWLENAQKSFSISTGALGYKFGNFSAMYHNKTNAVNVTFDARDVLYGNRIILNGQYFNQTNPDTRERELGTKWFASYKNYSISQLSQVYNKSNTYGILSNTTYWPGKYIFASAELSVPTKSFKLIANHTCTKTSMKLSGQLGEEENKLKFNLTTIKDISIEMDAVMNKKDKEASLKTFVLPYKQSFTVKSSYVSRGNEKGLHFKASHDNKNREFTWYTGYVNQTNEKSIKTNASVLGKPFEAKWTFFNYTTEKGLKFKSTAVGKSASAAVALIVKDGLKSIKVNGSALNKQAEAFWSYVNRGLRKSLNFDANIANKKFNADLTFHNMTNVKSLTFNAAGLKKTLSAALSVMNYTNDKVLKFNASALNKTIDALWMYSRRDAVRSLKFSASALNKTIESALSFFNLPQEKTVKLNATVLNKTVEALWSFFTMANEKGLKFSAKGLNKSVSSFASFLDEDSTKALKFNATALNKTVEAAWTYLINNNEKTIRFNVNAVNKTAEALWTYFNTESEKGLRFNAHMMNKSMQGVWSYFNKQSEKGLKFNATVMKKTVNASVSYFMLPESIGVQFNASALNKSIGLISKMLKNGDHKTVIVGGAYQNYSLALVAALKNLTLQKSLCFHSEFLSKRYGQICATFSNSSEDKSLALNISMLNRSAEVKAQRYETPNNCALRFSSKYNRTIFMESWLNYKHTDLLKSASMNMTILKKTVSAEVYMEKDLEALKRIFGLKVNVLKKSMEIKTSWTNHKTLKELSTDLFWNKSKVASSGFIFQNSTREKTITLRYHVGQYAAVMKAEHSLRDGQRQLKLIGFVRNGTTSLFSQSSQLMYSNTNGIREVTYGFGLTVLGRTFKYGWDLTHTNRSTEQSLDHEVKVALMYSRNKKVSLTSRIVNNKDQFADYVIVEYLPRKKVEHSIIWYKEKNNIITTIELLPRIPLVSNIRWSNDDGFFIISKTSLFKKTLESYFRFTRSSESYDGRLEYLPGKTVKVYGRLTRVNGLLITSNIEAFAKKWSHKLDINKLKRKFHISMEFLPKRPSTFEASWDMIEGLKIKTKLDSLKKSLDIKAFVERLKKSVKSDITVLKEKVLFFGNYDKATKTINGSIQIRNRRIGFVGRFDLTALVASAHLTCNEYLTGWSLKVDRHARNIIFNTTLTTKISGQVVAEMPNNRQLQVTFQRKLGVNVVNESSVIYKLSPEASRIFVTWNTTTVNYVASKIKSLKPIIIKETLNMYNATLKGAKNLTKQLEIVMKKMEIKLKPHAMKVYKALKNYDYNGVYKNISLLAKNISIRAVNLSSLTYNVSMKIMKQTIKDLPMLARNATKLYKKIRSEIEKFKAEKIPKITEQVEVQLAKVKAILKNVGVHLKTISLDLESWGKNVTIMVGDIKIRNVKVSHMVKRVVKIVSKIQEELMKNATIQAKKLIKKIRAIEIRKLKIGEMTDKLVLQVREFTCDFDGPCTWAKISKMGVELGQKAKNLKVLDKTLEQHFIILKEKTIIASKEAAILSRKLIKMAPQFARNTTINAIKLVRNLTAEMKSLSKIISKRVVVVVSKIKMNVNKYTRPLTKLIVKVSISIYNRVKPQIVMYIERVQPSIKYIKEMYKDVVEFNKPMITPFAPLSKNLMDQVLNITVKKIPIGAVLDKTFKMSVQEVGKLLREYNHTITSNVTAILKFIDDLSKKTPEEIIDITILKVFKLVNHTKELVNKTVEFTFNHSKNAMQSYKESMKMLNMKIKKIMDMRPEDVVELSIQNIHLSIKNMTALVNKMTVEVTTLAKQIKNLDLASPFLRLWNEIDLINRYSSLALGDKWNKIVDKYIQMFKSLDLKQRLMAIKNKYSHHGEKALKEFKEIATFGEKALNLTIKLVRLQVTREAFVKELLTIIEGSKLLATKHFNLAKDLAFTLYTLNNKYYETALKSVDGYKKVSLIKVKDTYKKIEKYIVEFAKEHEQEFNEAYEFYKDIVVDIYNIAEKETKLARTKAMAKLDLFKKSLIVRMEALVQKIRKYENMTYEEMADKVYQVSKKLSLEMYKKYKTEVIALYKKSKTVTLKTYNDAKLMAIKKYNIGKTHALRIFNATKNMTMTYYKLSRNLTIQYYHIGRNMTLKLYKITYNATLRGIEYLNKTVRPQMIVYYGKGKVYLIKTYKDAKELAKRSVEDVKIWYSQNKEKTVEELYNEVYGAVEVRVINARERVNVKIQELRAKLDDLKAKLNVQIKIANKTIREITKEVLSVYKQTKNVSIIAGKQLIAIFRPYAKVAQAITLKQYHEIKQQIKKTIDNMDFEMIYKAKNMTILYFKKAKTLALVNFNKAKNITIQFYRNITSRKEFKEFVAKHKIVERYNMAIAKAKELIEKTKAFIKETRPKIETKYRDAIHYVNHILPKMIKEKKAEIMANPKDYVKSIYINAKDRVNAMIKGTPVEEIIMHEIWSDYLEEFKQHEFAEISKEIAVIGKAKADAAILKLKENIKVLKQKVDELKLKLKNKAEELKLKAEKIYKDTKMAVKKGFNDFKQMKLKEIIEHRYVFLTIEFAKNTSAKVQNMTVQAKKITLKYVALGKVFYKNMTIKAEKYKQIARKFALELKKNCTIAFEKVKVVANKYYVIAKKYTDKAKKVSIKYYRIASNWTMVKINASKLMLNKTIEKCIETYKVKVVPYYKNKVIPFYENKVIPFYKNKVVPMYHKYRKLAIETRINMTKRFFTSQVYNLTLDSYNLTIQLLRNASKSTPRQTVLKIRNMTLTAYNLTIKTAKKAMNLTMVSYKQGLKKLNMTKVQINKFLKSTLKAAVESMKPMLPVLNFTKNEIVETIVFIDKYYGIEELLRQRVSHHYKKFHAKYQKLNKTLMHHYSKMQRESDAFLKTIPGLAKTSAYEALELVNKTIRFVHYSIGYVNTSVLRLRRAMPELKNYILIKEGVILINIPHPKPIQGDIESICKDACEKVKRIPETTKKMARQALETSKTYANKALVESKKWAKKAMELPIYRKAHAMAMKMIEKSRNHPLAKKYLQKAIYFLKLTKEYVKDINLKELTLKAKNHPIVLKYIALTKAYLQKTRMYLKNMDFKKIANLTKSYAPIAYNMTKEMIKIGCNVTRMHAMRLSSVAWNISIDLYNSTSPKHAMLKAQNYTMMALNMTMRKYQELTKKNQVKIEELKAFLNKHKTIIVIKARIAINKAQNISMRLLNMTKNNPIVQDYVNSTIHFMNVTRKFIDKVNFTRIANLTKHYAPIAINMTRDMAKFGFHSTRNFTINVAKIAFNITIDIYNSSSLREALYKAKNHSAEAYNETMRLYRILYKQIMSKYADLDRTTRDLYQKIYKHRITQKSLTHARKYYGHSMEMIESRSRHFLQIKKYWNRRIAHKVHHMRNLFNPINWIPPFNSTASIFGKDHVYTFDSQYFRFPGYKNEQCMYVLARDVRDNKFTLLSQKSALFFVSEDGNVKIHSSGKVESMVKITYDGQKIHDGFESELPVQTQNMTVFREGSYVVLRHELGVEIVCDVKHNLCTFNFGKWFHGRLGGLLGTNNNEGHDDMKKSDGKMATNLIDFVNSWEVTKNAKCQITREIKPKKCSNSKYIHRCSDLFKDHKSPFAPFFATINPKPFKLACERDYTSCDTRTAKDMKHCNVSATYVELLRMKGKWVDHLPECGRCGNNELGRKWFQPANGQVDVILVVPETEGMRGFTQKIPEYVKHLQSELSKYSLQFGLVSLGGKGIHSDPQQVTMNGKVLSSADEVKLALDHLKFSDTPDKDIDGFEGIAMATRYPFRAGATKIVVLWTTSERSAKEQVPGLERMTEKLKMQDITLNIIGKYQKYREQIHGQDYLGRTFYRKLTKGSIRRSPIPKGEFMQLMKNTEGAAFSITHFASDFQKRYSALTQSFTYTLKEQIKRDQMMCKECFCSRGIVGEGRAICKINKHHKC